MMFKQFYYFSFLSNKMLNQRIVSNQEMTDQELSGIQNL